MCKGMFPILGISTGQLIPIIKLAFLAFPYENGGLIAWAGTIFIAFSLGDLASMKPSSRGQYDWVYALAPPFCRKFLSYMTGYLKAVGWVSIVASIALLAATQIQSLAELAHPVYRLFRMNYQCMIDSNVDIDVVEVMETGTE
ncbi:hypothetical protein F5Y03DRAFT_355702 [Xylaria venustula]|nr:hypothetical protein F5Y03DRAFT_355702 [Xylaria venustula]